MPQLPMNRGGSERGSMPLALLATIVVAGLATVLVARIVAGERTVRFDNTFTRELHTADAGLAQALFHVSKDIGGLTTVAIGTGTTLNATVDQQQYEVEVVRESVRAWRVTSVARAAGATPGDGPERTVVAQILESPLFFPGAFGDDIVALNGTSSSIDSYHSTQPNPYTGAACTLPAASCEWGTSADFGTGNGSIGTNGNLDLSGGVTVRPGGAFLYDWVNNPPAAGSPTASNPFGSRCNGTTRCTTTYVSTLDAPIVYDTAEKMEFINKKFASGGGCATVAGNPRYLNLVGATVGTSVTTVGSKNTTQVWVPFDATSTNEDATDDAFTNYYCAQNLEILSHIRLDPAVTPSKPVVIFVKDGMRIPEPGTRVACHGPNSTTWCSSSSPRNVRPVSDRLQIYIAGTPASSGVTASSDVSVKSQSMIAGVFYAPRSRCGGTGGAGADVYGILICRTMDNVGNWDFHFDDRLGDRGNKEYSVATWNED